MLAFFVLAQIIDGRWAWYIGLGMAWAVGAWRSGLRAPLDYAGIAAAVLAGVGTFFVLIGLGLFQSSAVMGWVALGVGSAVALVVNMGWSSNRRFRREVDAIVSRPPA